MKRRQFLNLSLPTLGAALVGNTLLSHQSMADISRQFSTQNPISSYDLIINGAGLAGYFAALEAVKSGKKVLVIEKRTSPGFEIWAKGKLWIDSKGTEKWNQELISLFLPDAEAPEIENNNGTGLKSSQFGNETLLFNGSIRKGMVRTLLQQRVDVLLMTDVCGLFTYNNRVSGVMIASKHGIYKIDCQHFIDASDQLLLTRNLIGENPTVSKAGFVLEIAHAANPVRKSLSLSPQYGIRNNSIDFHLGKRSEDQMYISFEYDVKTSDIDAIEHQARQIAAQLGKNLRKLDPSLAKASITEWAFETSLTLANPTPPRLSLQGYDTLNNDSEQLSGTSILQIQKKAKVLIQSIKFAPNSAKADTLLTSSARIPLSALAISPELEPGLAIPLNKVHANWTRELKQIKQSQILVAGGGTAGALAAHGAIQKGANTMVVDYFNDLGGTKTMGGVMGYYHGFVKNKFFKIQNEEAERTALEANMSKKTGRKLYHLNEVVEKGGKFITGAIICDAIVDQNKVSGALICQNGVLKVLQADITIDATGDGDLAAFAGAEFQIGSTRFGETQNYSQWDIKPNGTLPSTTNRDYDIIDNTKMSELQRGLFLSHYEAHHYNFHPFLTVRESRRIVGTHVLDLIDCSENRHFKDVLALASTDFDPHNIGSSEYSKCGFLLPHSNDITVEVPYSSIVPVKLDGLLLAGRGYSQTHNALQFTRMTADILVLGYLTGQIAADLAWKKVQPRNYDVSALQQEWDQLGYIPEGLIDKPEGDQRNNPSEINRRVNMLALGNPEYLYDCSRIQKSLALPVLKRNFEKTTNKTGKLLLAKALAWFGSDMGIALISQELKEMFDEEMKQGYPNGYVDDYDFIRGREKNMLLGLFWRINQNIALIAMSGSTAAVKLIRHILENTESGGGMVNRTNDYFNGRIDLKIIPFHNRILSLCFYAERLPNAQLSVGFQKLLQDKYIGGFKTIKYENVRWRTYGGTLELNIAAAMARCGSKRGYELLNEYQEDIHSNFKEFASRELKALTQADFGTNASLWGKHIGQLKFPRPISPLIKEIEV